MARVQSFVDSYLDFHYGLGLAIAVIIFGILFCIMLKKCRSQGQSISWKEILCCLALSVYIVIILGGTLLNRTVGQGNEIKLQLFWSYCEVIEKHDKALMLQMVYNVLAFVPWGILLPGMWTWMRKVPRTVGIAAVFSLLIELTQLLLECGWFEFDDIFHNALGAAIGYGIWKLWKRWRDQS